MTKRNLCSKSHKWPEAIDIDGDGNLYFSDVVAKKIYRFTREGDRSLKKEEQLLLQGFKHASGISIDRDQHSLNSSKVNNHCICVGQNVASITSNISSIGVDRA